MGLSQLMLCVNMTPRYVASLTGLTISLFHRMKLSVCSGGGTFSSDDKHITFANVETHSPFESPLKHSIEVTLEQVDICLVVDRS